ncbi:MAG: transposase family protein [Candidatus Thiodiazotropha endolucinida]
MLTDTEFEEYLESHALPAKARDYISLTRSTEPSRLVGTRAKNNVCTWYPSRKMGCQIQAESRTAEYLFAVECEYSQDVLEFWDQCPKRPIVRTQRNGRRTGYYTADYLVLETTGPGVIEVKDVQTLSKLLAERPEDWLENEQGVVYRPASEAFEEIGLKHRVVSSATFNPIRVANLLLLLDARKAASVVSEKLVADINSTLSENAWLRLTELGEILGIRDFTPLLQLVDLGAICAEIDTCFLSESDSMWVSSSWDMLLVSRELRAKNTAYQPPLLELDVICNSVPSLSQAKHALDALKRIESGEKSRSVRRWKAMIREKAADGIGPFQAVLRQDHKKGNRTKRLPHETCKFLCEYIEEHHPDPNRTIEKSSYALYKNLANREYPDLPPVSRTTFRTYVRRTDPKSLAYGSGGRRAENAAAAPSPEETRSLKPGLPFELATMDHYLADIFCILVWANGVRYVARPWITVLVDVWNSMFLSAWISFKAPSVRSCAMAIRQCVRRHSRLPRAIVVDRGSEFQSVYFQSLAAHEEFEPVLRPSEHPRYGAEAERVFGEFKTQWLSQRPANIVKPIESRAVSSSHAASNFAILELEHFVREFHDYTDWREGGLIGIAVKSPLIACNEMLERYSCVGRPKKEDFDFLVATAVDVRSYKLDPVRGIHTDDDLHYWDPRLKDVRYPKRDLEVRKEPEDPYRIYTKIHNQWTACLATGARRFQTLDPIVRLTEAIRILDGKAARDQAKDDAEQRLIDLVLRNDELLEPDQTSPGLIEKKSSDSCESPSVSVFDDLREISVDRLETTRWGS